MDFWDEGIFMHVYLSNDTWQGEFTGPATCLTLYFPFLSANFLFFMFFNNEKMQQITLKKIKRSSGHWPHSSWGRSTENKMPASKLFFFRIWIVLKEPKSLTNLHQHAWVIGGCFKTARSIVMRVDKVTHQHSESRLNFDSAVHIRLHTFVAWIPPDC